MKTSYKKALDLLEKGNWQEAHLIVQSISTKEAALIHALVHRFEGDEWNAGYWYNRAREEFPKNSLDEEIKRLEKLIL